MNRPSSRQLASAAFRTVTLVTALLAVAPRPSLGAFEDGFRDPPASAKPWTYWFWMNGNITRKGITADLEAMARVGIGGVLIMEVASPQRMAPAGPVPFFSPAWRELFRHAVAEAGRLGLAINLNNDAGWTGSGGPWVKPEFSMQKVVSTSLPIRGPRRCEETLPQPAAVQGFYRDIKVLAYPAPALSPGAVAVPLPAPKKGKRAGKAAAPAVPAAAPIPADRIVDLTSRMNAAGRLEWDAPAGDWIVLRIGHTSTGQMNKPSPEAGRGLECDKFSAEALRRHFDAFVGRLAEEIGPAAGRVLTMTHIDSWEVGNQTWTTRMAEEFARRRGYELTPWLMVLAGGPPVGSVEQTGRFRRDFKRTQSELMNENYAAALRELAHRHGLKLSIEAYGPTGEFINSLDYATHADLPMAEFWVMRWGAWHLHSSRLVSSAVHAAGRSLVGAESFTATGENGSWTEHPYSIKTVGDWAFSEGVNHFVFHRTVLQPWSGYEPGMTFGPHGTHFDRNQTWWEPGAVFMRYLARCQFLLQQGLFVADVARLLPDGEEHGSSENHGSSLGMNALPRRFAPLPIGYNFDYLSDKLLSEKAAVKDGRLTFPGGMSYRVIQLPESATMTPELLRKLRDLVGAGAILAGPRLERSPSLRNFPECDAEVKRLGAELWGACDGKSVTEHAVGAGRVFWGRPMADVLRSTVGKPDLAFTVDPGVTDEAIMSVTVGRGGTMGKEPPGLMSTSGLNWIHRRMGDTDIYFVANPQHRAVAARCSFRVTGRQPEFWNPETGELLKPAVFSSEGGRTQVPIGFTPAGSVFVVFREPAAAATQVVRLKRGATILSGADAAPDALSPLISIAGGRVQLQTTVAGRYQADFADGRSRTVDVPAPAPEVRVRGPWRIGFQSGRGAPATVEFPALVDWAKHADDGIRHFSGTATYSASFDWQPSPASSGSPMSSIYLDLGRVEVMADVRLNGTNLGVLWKPPYMVEVSRALKPGRNRLELIVTNLWVNRLIGDERYPDDCTADGSWKTGPIQAWPEWFLKGQPRPEPRRLTFTTWKYYTAETPLLPSGLLGPVTLRATTRVRFD
ncbi:MAG: glycosyl hydrolase [Opitutaceae bacterium]|nr:glycosyl hydrolase [Opitutaceae bacterium]